VGSVSNRRNKKGRNNIKTEGNEFGVSLVRFEEDVESKRLVYLAVCALEGIYVCRTLPASGRQGELLLDFEDRSI